MPDPTPQDAARDDLAELLRRRALTEDAARPDAVERRHAAGGRTARENVADLVDPGSFVEYGRFAIAAQRQRRDLHDLIARTPGDGLIAGTARIDGVPCAVLSYDYTVLAGTQGALGHRKKDRLFELIERMRLPTVFFAEGGGGRPATPTTRSCPRSTSARSRCGPAVGPRPAHRDRQGPLLRGQRRDRRLLGPDRRHGGRVDRHGRPGDDRRRRARRGRARRRRPGRHAGAQRRGRRRRRRRGRGRRRHQEAARLLHGGARGAGPPARPDQTRLRDLVPERERRAYDVGPIIETLADEGSVTFLRERFAPEMVTALARIEGRPVGVIANNTMHTAGAITSDAADKAARFLQLCDAFGLPVLSLVDTPGIMVGPKAEATGLVRHASRLLVAGASLRVPLIAVVLRRGYGLGAQAMAAGSLHEPLLTVAWPGAHLGPMGLEGAVRLGLRKELEAIEDDDEREQRVREVDGAAQENAKALNAAQLFELDDVIDPADTRGLIAATLAAAAAAHREPARATLRRHLVSRGCAPGAEIVRTGGTAAAAQACRRTPR